MVLTKKGSPDTADFKNLKLLAINKLGQTEYTFESLPSDEGLGVGLIVTFIVALIACILAAVGGYIKFAKRDKKSNKPEMTPMN